MNIKEIYVQQEGIKNKNMTENVKFILDNYNYESPGIKANLYKLLMHGKLGGTGKLVILPVDQGFEHGPDKSFLINYASYDPLYHFKLAIDSGISAYAAPIGMLEAGAHKYAGQIPLILKLNSNNNLNPIGGDQAITSSIEAALKIGAIGVGFTIYPGSENTNKMIEEAAKITEYAKKYSLISVIWSYPRGPLLKGYETALDVTSYAAHIACLIGAHIVKVKLPDNQLLDKNLLINYEKNSINIDNLSERISHIKKACFDNKKILLFSGGASKNITDLLEEIHAINNSNLIGIGSIIGRNIFQRKYEDAIKLLDQIFAIYY